MPPPPTVERLTVSCHNASFHRTSIPGDCKFMEYIQSVPLKRTVKRPSFIFKIINSAFIRQYNINTSMII